jgi:SAM-dependent methyltransferase
MELKLTTEDRGRIEESIRQKYIKVAISPEGNFQYPIGRAGLEALAYDKEMIQNLPDDAVESYCGVGNLFTLGPIQEGETVLDIGCGTGVDTLIAAIMVGPEGKVVGIDMVPEMLERAMKNLNETILSNVTFQPASAENLPFPDESFDVVISNGVFNLIPDKVKALSEVLRVLKRSGRLMIADQTLTGQLPEDAKARIESWFR